MQNNHTIKQTGMTLVELITAMVVFSMFCLLIIQVFMQAVSSMKYVEKATACSQDTISFYSFLDTYLKDNAIIQSTGNYQFEFTTSDTYTVSIDGYTSDDAPYDIVFSKNGGTPNILLQNITYISTEDRPGLQFYYFDEDQVTANTTANIKTIQANLTFTKTQVHPANSRYYFWSSWALGNDTETIP